MKQRHPVYLNLFQYQFPAMALVSVLHRLSGFIVFLLIPLLLWLLQSSLASPSSFDSVHHPILHPLLRFFIWLAVSSLLYHLVAGIRHILMDMGLGESLKAAKVSSYIVFYISLAFIILVGAWLW